MNDIADVTNKFLNTVIPTEIAKDMCIIYNIEFKTNMTFKDALYAAVIREAKSGTQEAIKLAKKYGIYYE